MGGGRKARRREGGGGGGGGSKKRGVWTPPRFATPPRGKEARGPNTHGNTEAGKQADGGHAPLGPSHVFCDCEHYQK